MTKEEFLSVGIKLLGLYVLVLGCLAVLRTGTTMITSYYYMKAVSEPREGDSDARTASRSRMRRMGWLAGLQGQVPGIAVGVFEACLGLYLCRSGRLARRICGV